ncbi:MAG TPA: FkbM family methyltransferase [Pseudomonadales bacterium]|nr:FkbM family methyltransferase [Pseudomonadales bacterium]
MKVEEQNKNDVAGGWTPMLQDEPVTPVVYLDRHSTSIEVSLKLFPYLADHGFQEMVVLPGAFYIEQALRIHIGSLHAGNGNIKRIQFHSPVILSEREVTLSIEARWLDNQTVQYTFREATAEEPCAILEIERGHHATVKTIATAFSVEAFQQQAVYLGDQAGYYGRLKENGNQYGPRFQNLRHVWQSGEESLGRLCVHRNHGEAGREYLDPVFVDGVVQTLPALFLGQGQTFILKGVEEIISSRSVLPEEAWVHTRLRPKDEADVEERVGDLDVFDNSGVCRLQLRGVRFAYLDRIESKKSSKPGKTNIVVAATFTAEPVAESLHFWGDYFELPVQVSFAPYSQVFQELLDPSSQMRQNKDGVNAILLNLGDWIAHGGSNLLKIDSGKAAACFKNLERHVLPGGLEVAHLNRHETEYVYQEIFGDRCYLRHGIHLPSDAVVIDIGANIGLFSLFVRSQCPRASVYSYEPSPIAFQALKANCEAYGPNLHAFNAGVSGKSGSATLTFYGKSSVFSSFHPSVEEDRKAIQAVVANMVRDELGNSADPVDEYVEELMTDRLDQQTFECPLVSVPGILRENNLRHVDLLKVDAEKCELEILYGIDDGTWQLIDQVVIEVHDRTRRMVEEVQELLVKQGFQCAVEEEKFLTGSGLFNVYARRKSESKNNLGQNTNDAAYADLQNKIDEFVQAVDSFTRATSAPTILCLCPPAKKDSSSAINQILAESENYLSAKVREFPNVQVIGSETILGRYQSGEFHDAHANQLGHLPYTPEGFAAIGSSLFRTLTGLRRAPYKVIVLDCDNTLWDGVCGEEGPLGVTVSSSHRTLQEFMARQMDAGMLLCVCSKNSAPDVEAVFAQNPNMILKAGNIAGWRVNWSPKSENLKSLARELNVGLDSFIFVDDNPVECAGMRAQCPEVLTLELPSDTSEWPQFLDQVWAFDHVRVTEEDRTRTQKVLENVEREKYREQASTLKDFIDGLQLQVELFTPAADQISRISQLTQRTNQFNCTTIRRSESDILHLLEKQNGHCLAVKVSDRFGDYGMVGLLIYFENGDRYDVDTFLLSCRVLGRGVEYQVLSQFGQLALKNSKQEAKLHFRPTEKNQPAWEFIKAVGAEFMEMSSRETIIFQFPAEKLAALRYNPDSAQSGRAHASGSDSSETKSKARPAAALVGLSGKFRHIAVELNDLKKICPAIDAHKSRAAGNVEVSPGEELPATLAGKILNIWRRVIGNARVGMNDNFIEAGGTSLKAVQVVAAIRRELNLHLSIVNIFECPTVRLLCEKLEPGKPTGGSVNAAIQRGARRRQQLSRRPA